MKKLFLTGNLILWAAFLLAQPSSCIPGSPALTIHFGTGTVGDINTTAINQYERVKSSCPTDGYYTYTSYSSNCFNGDWFTLTEDHTPGDVRGNMMLVNAAWERGAFLSTVIKGLKPNTTYELGAWLMNVCRISEKCPYPLLPDLIFRINTLSGQTIARMNTGELGRHHQPQWKQYKALFNTPPDETVFILTVMNNNPGGCGNDLALDDITFSECVPPPPPAEPTVENSKPETPPLPKPITKERPPVVKQNKPVEKTPTIIHTAPVPTQPADAPMPIPLPPPTTLVLTQRTNTLVKQIETEAGEIKIALYDNGEIDGDTVSIYHNNTLLIERARLSQKPITLRIQLDANNPHHELIMVAENLGSIPPNTSLMMVTAGDKRYQVFISSDKQKNAKVVLHLKE